MTARDRIERGFESWGRTVHRRAWLVVMAALAAVAGLATQLPKIQFDTSTESFLMDDDPTRVLYDEFREQYGRDELIVIAVVAPDVLDPSFLRHLRALHEELENEVPKLHDVTSLINVRNTRGEADELIVEDLLEEWPETPEAEAALRERVMSNPLYRNNLIDDDAQVTTIVIETDAYSSLGQSAGNELAGFDDSDEAHAEPRPFITGEENSEIILAILDLIERHEAPGFKLHLAGSPTMMHHLQIWLRNDMALFTGLAVLAIAILLAALLRTLAGVVLPLAISLLSLTATLGLMAGIGLPLSLPSQILPPFLLAVGVGGAVHVLVIFYQALDRGEDTPGGISFALGHSGLAIAMTGLTTAGGLSSFAAAELGPIAEFGSVAPVGVLMTLLLTLTLLPALIAIFPIRRRARADESRTSVSGRVLVRCGEMAVTHAWTVTLACAGLLGIAVLGVAQLRFSHDPLAWFPEDDYFRVASELINDELKGSMYLEVVIDSGRENGLHDPELLARIDEMRRWSSAYQYQDLVVGKTVSLVDVVKEIHQALNENRRDFYTLPDDRQLIAQELLLFENSGSDDLNDFVDSTFRTGRFTLKLPFVDSVQYEPFMNRIEEQYAVILGDHAEFHLTGIMAVMGRTFMAVIRTMARSYAIALAVITPLMILLIGSLRLGLLAMIPNLFPIIITLGTMGWMGLTLDMFTLLIGSIAIGLAVDDTIHFMHNFRRYYERTGDVAEAVRSTLTTTGQALLFTSLVLSAGFSIFAFASLTNLVVFGLLTSLTIVLAFLADLILAPALLALVARREIMVPSRAPLTEGIS